MRLSRKHWGILGAAAAVGLLFIFRTQAGLLLQLLLGSAVIAFLVCPLCDGLVKGLHLSRSASILLSYLALGFAFVLALFLLIPTLVRQLLQLAESLPALTATLKDIARQAASWLEIQGFPLSLSLPDFPWEQALGSLSPLLDGTATLAGSLVSFFTQLTLMLTLAFYFLRDRERLFLQLELAIPSAWRKAALRMGHAVRQELNTYLRGQALVSLSVGALAAVILMLLGVPGFLVLGLLVGLFNLIPYFGPVLGGIPVVLMTLTQSGLKQALLAVAAMILIQQTDNLFISPRIMGSVTGLHPALVLIAITLGGSIGGLPGMLFAVPCVLIIRALIRSQSAHSLPVTAKNRTEY